MPYGSNDELPEGVRNALPEEAQTVYREAYNGAQEGGNDEDSCHAIAWTAVKNGWKPPDEDGGKWTRKQTFVKKLTIDKDFQWDDGSRIITFLDPEIPMRFQKFQWLPDWTLPDWATGRLFYFSTLSLDKMLNQVEFSEREKIRCAGSLVGAPINLNHKIYGVDGINVVLDSEEEDNRVEGLCYVESNTLLDPYDRGEIVGCSIDYTDRSKVKEDWGFTATGVTCWGLAWVTGEYICGDPSSRVWEATGHDPNLRDIERRQQTVEKPKVFCPKKRQATIDKRLQYAEPSDEDRLEWLEEDIRSLYNQLWNLEERIFDRFDAMDKRISDAISMVSGVSVEKALALAKIAKAKEAIEKFPEMAEFLTHEVGFKTESIPLIGPSLFIEAYADRVKEHFYITDERWDELSDAEKQRLIHKLAEWTTDYINDLPDDCFAVIEAGGEKDEEGKTTPRDLRHLPYKDAEGNLDQDHIAAALQAIGGARTGETPPYADEAKPKLCAAAKELEMDSEVCGTEGDGQETLILDEPEEWFAWIDGGGERHFQMKDDNGYNEEMLRASMHDLLEMHIDGDISNDCFETARHGLIEGFNALGLDIPDEASEPEPLVDIRHRLILMRRWEHRQAFRDRFNPLRRGDDGGERNRPPTTSVPTRGKREVPGYKEK